MFHELTRLAHSTAAAFFTERDADGRAVGAWFYPERDAPHGLTPEQCTVEVDGVISSARRFGRMDMAGRMSREQNTITVSMLSDAIPYRPVNGKTVFWLGTRKETARKCLVQDFRYAGGVLEIEIAEREDRSR